MRIEQTAKTPSQWQVKRIGFNLFVWIALVFSSAQVLAEETGETSPITAGEAAATTGTLEEPIPMAEPATKSIETIEFERQKRLEAEIDSLDSIWISVTYPDSASSIEVLGLEQASRQPNAQGAVLILHDKFHHADWPGAVRILRHTLPDSGWHTLSISLPADVQADLPERELPTKSVGEITITDELKNALANRSGDTKDTDSGANAPAAETPPPQETDETESDATGSQPESAISESEDASTPIDINLSDPGTVTDTILPYEERVLSHIEAGMQHLADRGYLNNIIIAFGHSAQSALNYIKPKASSIEAQGFALILVNARLDEAFQADIGKALGKQFKAPVLDLVDGSAPSALDKAKRRLTMARVAQAATYQQVTLSNINYSREHKTLLKRIDAWLMRYAPGMSARSVKDF